MQEEKSITLKRDCIAVVVPSGEAMPLKKGTVVWLTQSLGGTYTVITARDAMARIDGAEGEALGFPPHVDQTPQPAGDPDKLETMEKTVWDRLRSCVDPEIPVNIVDLGLIYD